MADKNELLRQLPAINIILQRSELQSLVQDFGHREVTEAATEVVQIMRNRIRSFPEGKSVESEINLSLDFIVAQVVKRVREKTQPRLRRVVNATGIILHTNLGRAIISKKAIDRITEVAAGYSNLELDLSTGERGSRYAHVEGLISRITGAEDAMVVNNNAGAVLLVLNTLARDQEVVVSRGQLVEIGGSFRIPDVMNQSGATLVEVGATNKTHLNDYLRAINEHTALLLKVHTSNYRIVGFTSEVSAKDLVRLGKDKGIPVYEDLGSGVLVDFRKYGLAYEPTVQESVRLGVDIVSFSGDKLFGGPQAGIIVGRRDLIEKCKKNPLTRALRVDKFTFAALEATLRLYIDEEMAVREVPTLRMLTISYQELQRRAIDNAEKIKKIIGDFAEIKVEEGCSQVGGGALPEEDIPTPMVFIRPYKVSVNWLEEKLRSAPTPILARIQKDMLLVDYRTVLPEEEEIIIDTLKELFKIDDKKVDKEAWL